MMNIQKVGLFLKIIPFDLLQKYSQTYQTLFNMANENIYHHFCHLFFLLKHKDMYVWTSMVC